MHTINVDKSDLIEILKENKTKHEELYDEAVIGYHEEVVEKLSVALDKAEAGEEYVTNLKMTKPEHHLKDYNRIIGMLELATETEIELNPNEYDQYVNDEWSWAGMTNSINAMYASKVSYKQN